MMVTARQARWTGMVVLLITFAAGGIVGAATMHLVADEVPAPRREKRPQLFERLDLTPEQQVQVDAVMERRRREMDAFWREHGPTMRAIYDSTRMEIRAFLTPEQIAIEEQYRAERQKHFQQRRPPEPPR